MTLIKRVVLFDLPLAVKGYCFNDSEGDKVCVLNSRYTRLENWKLAFYAVLSVFCLL